MLLRLVLHVRILWTQVRVPQEGVGSRFQWGQGPYCRLTRQGSKILWLGPFPHAPKLSEIRINRLKRLPLNSVVFSVVYPDPVSGGSQSVRSRKFNWILTVLVPDPWLDPTFLTCCKTLCLFIWPYIRWNPPGQDPDFSEKIFRIRIQIWIRNNHSRSQHWWLPYIGTGTVPTSVHR